MSRTRTVVPSPIGPLTVVQEGGELVRLAMSPPSRSTRETLGERSGKGLADVVRQLGEYFAGERAAFDLPLRPVGATSAGACGTNSPASVRRDALLGRRRGGGSSEGSGGRCRGRALRSAQCQQAVIGADGSLIGFGGGLPRKRFLLDQEQRADRLF